MRRSELKEVECLLAGLSQQPGRSGAQPDPGDAGEGVGFQKSATFAEQRLCATRSYVDQATQDRSTRDAFMVEIRGGVGRP